MLVKFLEEHFGNPIKKKEQLNLLLFLLYYSIGANCGKIFLILRGERLDRTKGKNRIH